MPAKSKAQFRFMKAVEGEYIKPKGLSKKEAKEYTTKNKSYKDLPEKANRFNKLEKKMSKKKS